MKNKKKIIIPIVVIVLLLALIIAGYFIFFRYNTKIKLKTLEVGKTYKINDIVKVKNGKLKSQNVKITMIGKKKVTFEYKDRLGKTKKESITINVVDKEKPKINTDDEITLEASKSADLLEIVTGSDNYDKTVDIKVEGEYDLSKKGQYKVVLVATDKSGNKTTKNVTINVTEKEKPKETVKASNNSTYYVKINKTLNVMMVYSKDESGNYDNLVQTFVVSTGGANTPNGVFNTTDKVETLSLVGGVWGHYTVRITGPIWFHSVPYYTKPETGADGNLHWNNLEYEEYNKLGTTASLGCVRLSTIDAKWVYDNLPWNTPVEIYESNELPKGVVKPSAIKIDVKSENRGWDPTDPDPFNPWH